MQKIIQCDEGRIRDEAEIIQYEQTHSDEVFSPIVVSFRCLPTSTVLMADLGIKQFLPVESVFYFPPGESHAPFLLERGTENYFVLRVRSKPVANGVVNIVATDRFGRIWTEG